MTATATATKTKRTPVPLNGVDTPTLLATIGAVGAQPALAKFQFRANNRWVSGTHNQSTMHGFFGAGGEHKHVASYKASGDHPAVAGRPPCTSTEAAYTSLKAHVDARP